MPAALLNNNPRWLRIRPLSPPAKSSTWTETWMLSSGESRCEVEVRVGKAIDILRLKSASVEETRDYASFLSDTAQRLYQADTVDVLLCPCCAASTAACERVMTVYEIDYVRCPECGHTFVRRQPSPERLNAIFKDSEEHSDVYVDRGASEIRIEQIIRPKLDYVLDAFRTRRGRLPESILDVGAGAGHFVAECRARGIAADGIEISQSSRRFAKDVFDIELIAGDFLQPGIVNTSAELITLWGVLEYAPRPVEFLKAAHRLLQPDGMLVVEVPRADALGTMAQSIFPGTVARHMDPTSHMNAFSDGSLASALSRSGFRPVAAWYFGMDVYELFLQMSLNGSPEVLSAFASAIPQLQANLDATANCDDIIVIAERV